VNASGGVVDVSDPRTCVPCASRAAEGEADPTSPMEEDDDVSTAAMLEGAPGGSDDDSDDYDPSASKVCAPTPCSHCPKCHTNHTPVGPPRIGSSCIASVLTLLFLTVGRGCERWRQ
jgi:hypothetical protein